MVVTSRPVGDAISRRVAEAAAWCSMARSWAPLPHECFSKPSTSCRFAEHRSPELARQLVSPFVEKSGEVHALATKGPATEDGRSVGTDVADRAALVADLLERRAALLGPQPMQSRETLHGGRLLVLLPPWSLFEGACQLESNCFFDVFDTPPWDTWVWHEPDEGVGRDPESDCLLAWVPPGRLNDVERGIQVSSTECVFWASELEGPLGRSLRNAGLV